MIIGELVLSKSRGYVGFEESTTAPGEAPTQISFCKPDKQDAAQESRARGIKPFRFFEQLEGRTGLDETLLAKDYPYEVYPKFNGMRIQIHKKADAVKIYSVSGKNLTAKLEKLVSGFKSIRHDFVLDAELTGATGGKTIGGSTIAGYIHARQPVPADIELTANIFDLLYYDGKDLHNLALGTRRKQLESLPKNINGINIIQAKCARNWLEMEKAVAWTSASEGSEGAMIKAVSSSYPLNGVTNKWIKYKKEVRLDSLEKLPEEGYFILTEICWKESITVRDHLFLQIGQKKLDIYLDGNPILLPTVSAGIGELLYKKWSHLVGKVPNESVLNPEKKTPATQSRLAQGKFKLLHRDPDRVEFSFDSTGFTGDYILQRARPKTSLWIFKKVS